MTFTRDGSIRNVRAHIYVFPADLLRLGISGLLSVGDRVSQRRSAQHATAVSDNLARVESRTRVKHFAFSGINPFETANFFYLWHMNRDSRLRPKQHRLLGVHPIRYYNYRVYYPRPIDKAGKD